MVRASDASLCGNAIAEYRDNIVIIEHGAKFREYIVPKSKVERYDGRDVYLNIPRTCSQLLTSEQSFIYNSPVSGLTKISFSHRPVQNYLSRTISMKQVLLASQEKLFLNN